MHYVELSTRAERDLRKLDPGGDRDRVVEAIRALMKDPHPPNLDVRPLTGARPWLRLRTGDWRLIFRPLDTDELDARSWPGDSGYVIDRIVNRRDLHRAIEQL